MLSAAPFALLDDSRAEADARRCRLYTGYLTQFACHEVRALPGMLQTLQDRLAQGEYAIGLFDYELGARMQGVKDDRPAPTPLARVLIFGRCDHLTPHEAQQWLQQQDTGEVCGVAAIRPSIDEDEFVAAISRIRAWIEAGDTYQVNYTYRLHFEAYGSPLALYRRLRQRQPVPYGALIVLPEGGAALSLSPELFVRHTRGQLLARPMKGTAPASEDDQENARRAAALAADEKNRSENLMIVDLLRNDLGRVARPGSVTVPNLFQVERFSSVLQMTSTIQAQLRDEVSLSEVFTALYPCGSITGAPKRRTMQIIDELETEPRGLYTGAIGWFDAPVPGQTLIGDFCLSVPIRTLVLERQKNGVRRGVLGVGAGIVYDSEPRDEYAECMLKARFLTGLKHEFDLFETMYATQQGCRHLDRHLARLQASARYFAFPWDEDNIRRKLQESCGALPQGLPHRVRLVLNREGEVEVQASPLTPIEQPVRLLLSPQPVESSDLFLRHKTSVRTRFDVAWRSAEAQGAFDMLFFNERDEVTEGARSNLLLKLDGRWYTPHCAAGLLPGVMRAVLLEDPVWQLSERPLTRSDLYRAEQVAVCNALRGVLPARIVGS